MEPVVFLILLSALPTQETSPNAQHLIKAQINNVQRQLTFVNQRHAQTQSQVQVQLPAQLIYQHVHSMEHLVLLLLLVPHML